MYIVCFICPTSKICFGSEKAGLLDHSYNKCALKEPRILQFISGKIVFFIFLLLCTIHSTIAHFVRKFQRLGKLWFVPIGQVFLSLFKPIFTFLSFFQKSDFFVGSQDFEHCLVKMGCWLVVLRFVTTILHTKARSHLEAHKFYKSQNWLPTRMKLLDQRN